ncbi:ABC transporter substrate-binding protein [Phosphitispora sp. TUW77]|uniref:ABC transporter substrate-binding protein n=1 Tax=Phosphitispora sp. TUW77 TaxID=3152361 RepID=UPI003AB17523
MYVRRNLGLKFISIILILVIGLIGTGCGAGNKESAAIDKLLGSDTIQIRDCIGRKAQIPAKVERIACLYAFTGHVVTMLGQGDKIVAVVNGLKRDTLLNEMVPSIGQALVPSTEGAINIEELIKAKPDLVFIRAETAAQEGETEKLNKSGIPYLVVDFNSIEEQKYAIEMIAKAVGVANKGKKYNQYYQDCLDLIEQKLTGLPDKDRLKVYHSVNEASRTDSPNTLPADWMQRAGVINVSVNDKLKFLEGKYYANLEQIFLWDPDIIIANEPGVGGYILDSEQWAGLRAVKEGKVFQMPIGISRWGHPGSLETPLAVLWMAKTAYPKTFQDLDMVLETKTFYKQFFNIELNDDGIARILQGQGMRTAKGDNKTEGGLIK